MVNPGALDRTLYVLCGVRWLATFLVLQEAEDCSLSLPAVPAHAGYLS